MKFLKSSLTFSRRAVKGILTVLVSLLVILLLLPELFPGFVSDKIKLWANQSLASRLDFSTTRLSFIRHFPSLTLSMYDYSLMSVSPFEKDTLASGKELAFGIELTSLFGSKLNINRVYINESSIKITVDEKGKASYHILKPTAASNSSDTGSASLLVDGIRINHCTLLYDDRSLPIMVKADDLNYKGSADLSKDSFYLASNFDIGSLDLVYAGNAYVDRKSIHASLSTSVNSHALSVYFQKDDIRINELPLRFNGMLRFINNGYDLDFRLNTGKVSFQQLLSVLPHSLMDWYQQTTLKGDASFQVSLKGTYNAAAGTMPDLTAGINVSNGYIKYGSAADAVSDLQVSFKTRLPALDPSRMIVKLDTLGFRMGTDFFSNKHHSKGFNPMFVQTRLQSKMDLGKLTKAIGISTFELTGIAGAALEADGWVSWNYDAVKHRTQITSLPVFTLNNRWQHGYLKLKALPYSLSDINLQLRSASNKTGRGLSGLSVDITPVSFKLAGEPFALQAKLWNFDDLHYALTSKGSIDLGKMYAVFQPNDVSVKGYVETDLSLRGTQSDTEAGNWDKIDNEGSLRMRDIRFAIHPYPRDFILDNGLLEFKTDKIWLQQLVLAYGKNNMQVTGYAENILRYLLRGERLTTTIELRSEQFDVNDFTAGFIYSSQPVDSMQVDNATVTNTGSALIMLPVNMDASVKASVSQLLYNNIMVQNFKGALSLQDGQLNLEDTKFSLADALFKFSGTYQAINPDSARFLIRVKADSFDIQKAYTQLALFRELAPAAAKANGLVSLKYQVQGALGRDMMPRLNSLKGGGDLSLEQVKIYGLKLFSAVSKATGKDSIDNPQLNKVLIRTSIADNIMRIDRTRMKVFGFRPRLEGEATLDGRLNLKFRLGLPPFGVLGIPMTIRGTGDHPLVKFKRGNDGYALTDSAEVAMENDD